MKTLVELCGGSAALSCVYVGGVNAKPPTSYMGSKRGYIRPILGAFGLTPGEGRNVILAEPGPYGQVWRCLTQPGGAQQVADIIRGWEGEEPRALWTRLRDEWKADPTLEAARYLVVAESNPLIPVGLDEQGRLRNTGKGGSTYNDLMGMSCAQVRAAVESVARWLVLASWSLREVGESYGTQPEGRQEMRVGIPTLCDRTERTRAIGWQVYDRAQDVPIPLGAADHVVYIDPPYRATTGYAHNLSREEVVRLASLWASAGAFVGVSEQEPIPELVADGWHVLQIDGERRGQKRTFSKQKSEYLTLSRPPVARPGVQVGMFT